MNLSQEQFRWYAISFFEGSGIDTGIDTGKEVAGLEGGGEEFDTRGPTLEPVSSKTPRGKRQTHLKIQIKEKEK